LKLRISLILMQDLQLGTQPNVLINISVGAANTILRSDLKMRRVSARSISHLLTKEQKLDRVRIPKQLLKQFLKYNNRPFANIITDHETEVHFYERKRKIHNKIWATKGS
jgi:hypothetical protein